MSTFVVDSNIINRNFKCLDALFGEKSNKIIFTDNLIFEKMKSSKDFDIFENLKMFEPYIDQILFADGRGDLTRKELNNNAFLTTLTSIIPSDSSSVIKVLFDMMKDKNNSHYTSSDAYKQKLDETTAYKNETTKEFLIYKTALHKKFSNLKNNSGLTDATAKITEFVLDEIKKFLISDYKKDINEANRIANMHKDSKSFFFRSLLSDLALFFFYLDNGSFPANSKLHNSIIDSSFHIYASYADFFLSNDRKCQKIYKDYFVPFCINVLRIDPLAKSISEDDLKRL